jgi:hypothetical protein
MYEECLGGDEPDRHGEADGREEEDAAQRRLMLALDVREQSSGNDEIIDHAEKRDWYAEDSGIMARQHRLAACGRAWRDAILEMLDRQERCV